MSKFNNTDDEFMDPQDSTGNIEPGENPKNVDPSQSKKEGEKGSKKSKTPALELPKFWVDVKRTMLS
jgi:hypothetical protein